jgi:hypothetical protein
MAHTEFLQGEITERFLPATGVEELSGESGQVAFSTWVTIVTIVLLVAICAQQK